MGQGPQAANASAWASGHAAHAQEGSWTRSHPKASASPSSLLPRPRDARAHPNPPDVWHSRELHAGARGGVCQTRGGDSMSPNHGSAPLFAKGELATAFKASSRPASSRSPRTHPCPGTPLLPTPKAGRPVVGLASQTQISRDQDPKARWEPQFASPATRPGVAMSAGVKELQLPSLPQPGSSPGRPAGDRNAGARETRVTCCCRRRRCP